MEDKKQKKVQNKTKRKDYFGIIFASVSVIMFFILIFSIYFLKNSLYEAKDQASLEFVNNYEKNLVSESEDPFVGIKGSSFDQNISSPQDTGLDPSLGATNAKVKIFYFSDFSCPFCFEQENIIKKVYDKFKNDVHIIWKDYPDVSSLSSFSFQASRAARCANEQDRFWDYNSLLYQQENSFANLKNELFLNLAKDLKLDLDRFSKCLIDSKIDNIILDNVSEAESLGLPGIPYIYINDRDFLGDLNEDELEDIINLEIKKTEE